MTAGKLATHLFLHEGRWWWSVVRLLPLGGEEVLDAGIADTLAEAERRIEAASLEG